MSGSLTNAAENIQEVSSDENSNAYLESLVGDGKKYKTPDELARAYINADKHIRELREDLDAIKQDREAFHEIVNELRKPTKTEQNQPSVQTPTAVQSVSKEEIAEVIESTLTQREQTNTYKRNTELTLQKLVEVYGSTDAALLAVKRIYTANPALRKVIDDMGGADPDAAVAFVLSRSPKESPRTNTPGIGRENPETITEVPHGFVTWSQARELKKKDPKRYQSAEFKAVLEKSYAHFQGKGVDFFAT